jgi:DNA polymerase III epsilon subunit-like protein
MSDPALERLAGVVFATIYPFDIRAKLPEVIAADSARLAISIRCHFDTSFLGELYRRGSMFCPAALYEPLDTLPLARWYTSAHPSPPANHKLETLAEWLGLPAFEAHDALADVRATVAVARELCKRLGIGSAP